MSLRRLLPLPRSWSAYLASTGKAIYDWRQHGGLS